MDGFSNLTNPISRAFQQAVVLPAPSVADFSFLPRYEAASALDSYIQVENLLLTSPALPSGALFDIDGTLQQELHGPLIGRSVGAMFAFANAGVPVGLFSMRLDAYLDVFLEEAPRVAELIAHDQNGRRLAFGNGAFVEMSREIFSDVTGATLLMNVKKSDRVPGVSVFIPVVEMALAGFEQQIFVPKFSPAENVIVVDDHDYRAEYGKILGYLREKSEYDAVPYGSALMSMNLLWHLATPMGAEGFRADQLERLQEITGFISKSGRNASAKRVMLRRPANRGVKK